MHVCIYVRIYDLSLYVSMYAYICIHLYISHLLVLSRMQLCGQTQRMEDFLERLKKTI